VKTIKAGLLAIVPLFIVVALFIGQAMSDARSTHDYSNISLSIVATGDTAEVHTVTVKLTSDSGLFLDSVFFTNDTSQHYVASLKPPVQTMIFTLAGNTGDLTKLDTVGIGVVRCSVAFAAETLGVDYDLSTGADSTIATAYDSIVDIFNSKAALTDSVDAQDSATYIKFVSLFGEEKFTKRWSMRLSSDSTDTAAHVTQLSKNAICDSLVALINGDDSAAAYLTAAVATDTSTTFTLTSNDPGVPIHSVSVTGSDTMASAVTQENVTSWSRKLDTIALTPAIVTDPIGPNYRGFDGFFKVVASPTTTQGIGSSDSVYLQLWSAKEKGGATEYTVLAGDTCNACPCSLEYTLPPDTARAAITLGEKLFIWVQIADSASDTTCSILYPFRQDYIIYEDK
jgi:hypothetical protein